MSENPTREEVLASIVPRSDQINADDLIASGPITVTVEGVKRGDKDQPIIISLEGYDRGFRPCKSMHRVLIATWSDDPKRWVGQKLTIFTDPDVKYAGVKVGGIRISHASGIDRPKTFMLTQKRGQKAEVVIHPIEASAPSSVSQERLDWLKVRWADRYADILGPDDDKKLLFGQWVKQTLGEDFNPGGKLDVSKPEDWTPENMQQCEEALNVTA